MALLPPSLVERLLGSGGDDPGCEATFQVLDEYVEALIRDDDVTATYATVVRHLRNCAACVEDAEGLTSALRDLRAPS